MRAPITTPSAQCINILFFPPTQVTVEDGKVFVTAKKKVLTIPAASKHHQHLGLGTISLCLTFF